MEKTTLSKFSKEELCDYIVKQGEMKFRAEQIHSWIWAKNAKSFDDMTDVKKEDEITILNQVLTREEKEYFLLYKFFPYI